MNPITFFECVLPFGNVLCDNQNDRVASTVHNKNKINYIKVVCCWSWVRYLKIERNNSPIANAINHR